MNRKPKFIIVLLSAAITFGGLWAVMGQPPYAKHHHGYHKHCHTEVPKDIPQQ
ncbi:MAG: hypothetical protein R2774_10825 [Saprospiraceae bacterium]